MLYTHNSRSHSQFKPRYGELTESDAAVINKRYDADAQSGAILYWRLLRRRSSGGGVAAAGSASAQAFCEKFSQAARRLSAGAAARYKVTCHKMSAAARQ
jgi:hypothetical protein